MSEKQVRRTGRTVQLAAGVLLTTSQALFYSAHGCPLAPHASAVVKFHSMWEDVSYVAVGVQVELSALAGSDFSYDPDDVVPPTPPYPGLGITDYTWYYSKDGGAWVNFASGASAWPTFYEPGKYVIRLTITDNDEPYPYNASDLCTVYVIRIELTEPSFIPLGSPLNPPATSHDVSYTCTIIPSTLPASARDQIEIWMDSRSCRPGYCCNSTQEVQGYEHDYRFYLSRNAGFGNGGEMTGQKLVKDDPSTGETVKLTSRDYGGYGEMKAKVEIEEDWYYAKCSRDLDRSFVRVPRDDNDNDISDAWAYNSGNATDDDDANPGGLNNGDGFERYEEYRGFLIQGSHVRTNPNNKDLFIYDEDSLGFGYATDLGFTLHSILSSEWSGTGSRKMNANEDNDQRGIWLYDGGEHDQAYGITSGTGDKPWTPNNVIKIQIFTEKIEDDAPNEPKRIQGQNEVIAHEIGHAVGLAPLGSNTQTPDPDDPHHYPYIGCIMDKYVVWASVPRTQYCGDCQDNKQLH